VIGSNWGQAHAPSWYYNLRANPQATGSIDGVSATYQAHEAMGAEYDRLWQLAEDTYAGYSVYKTRASHRRIPVMVLTPATA
jgi:deazaflavin-dependent oxidoreductase (nitroreductase family)